MPAPKILTIDIETSPNVAFVWGLFKQTVALSQLVSSTRLISFAAKWHHSKRVIFYSEYHNDHHEMIEALHALLSEADIVVHFNGRAFDIPHINREFLEYGMDPPTPYKDVDLYLVARKTFKFPSNKLQYISEDLGLTGKLKHEGFELWVKCLAGDSKAWYTMRKYNMQDVVTTEELYDRLLPWITSHPHYGLYTGEEHGCARCGSTNLRREGYSLTALGRFQRYQCRVCGGWSRGKTRIQGVDERSVL